MTSHDWRHQIRERAAAADIELPEATVDEIAEHLADLHAGAVARGSTPAAAAAAARQALEESTLEVLRQHAASRARRVPERVGPAGGRSLNVRGALRMALRQPRRRPGFAAVTILVLALGIGASTTVFTVVDSVLLRPLPYANPDRLVTLWDANAERGLSREPISPVNFMDYRALSVFSGAAAWHRPSLDLVDPGLEPLRVNAIQVTRNLFEVLGVRPQIGEGFPTGGAIFGGESVVVISDRLWRTRYGGDPTIVGRQLVLNGDAHTVAGVMPPRFHYPDDTDVWQRLGWDLTQHSRGAHFFEAVLRLADGVTLEQATAAADTLAQRLEREYAVTNSGWGVRLIPLLEDQLGYYRPALLIVGGAVGLVLLIGCLNVASLLLTRALSREREVALRVAIGASPRQLITQLFAESLVLSAAGASVGVLASLVALPALVRLAPAGIPRLDEATVDLRALGLVITLAAFTTIVFGLVPSLALLRKGSIELRSGERGSSQGARRAYSILVTGQVALACTLLVSSALLIRTVVNMVSTPTGVEADGVTTTSVQLPSRGFQAGGDQFEHWQGMGRTHAALLDEIRQQPGVVAAGATNFLPLDAGYRMPFLIEGDAPARPDDRPVAQYHTVSHGYFESMGATPAAGRLFNNFDLDTSPGVLVVNEAFARRYFGGEAAGLGRIVVTDAPAVGPLGRNLLIRQFVPRGDPRFTARFEVIGIIHDVRNTPIGQAIEPALYFSARQFPFREMVYTVRASDTATAVAAVRTALTKLTPNVPMGVSRTWEERMATRTAEPRLLMVLLVFFGAAAGLLAALGIYGLFSWSVAQRTRELAIRLTLGARPVSVGASIVRQTLVLVAAGLVAGFGIIRAAETALARVLFDMTPRDPASLLGAAALLAVVALIACVPPALRALRVDPVEGLRAE